MRSRAPEESLAAKEPVRRRGGDRADRGLLGDVVGESTILLGEVEDIERIIHDDESVVSRRGV